MYKVKYKILGLDCSSCAAMLELDLEDLGIKARCNYAKSELEVEFDQTKLSEKDMIKKVRSLGYTIE